MQMMVDWMMDAWRLWGGVNCCADAHGLQSADLFVQSATDTDVKAQRRRGA